MIDTFLRSDSCTQSRNNVVTLLLRLTLAVVFLYHGWAKVSDRNNDWGATWAIHYFEAQSEPLPESLTYPAMQLAIAWGELLGGVGLALGLLTRLAALGMIAIQVGAIFLVTFAHGFVYDKASGYEYNMTLASMCLALCILSGGRYSLDHLLSRRRAKTQVPIEAVREGPVLVSK
jgi:putative oxidoreductase